MARMKVTLSEAAELVDVPVEFPWTRPRFRARQAAREFSRLDEPDVFYAPLDGSRIDYHPCGRPDDHPVYIDPETGQVVRWPEAAGRWEGHFGHPPVPHRCGRCGRLFLGSNSRGRYILHECAPLETLDEWCDRRDREGRDY